MDSTAGPEEVIHPFAGGPQRVIRCTDGVETAGSSNQLRPFNGCNDLSDPAVCFCCHCTVSDRMAPRWLLSIHRHQKMGGDQICKVPPTACIWRFCVACVYVCELFVDKSSVCTRSELPHFFSASGRRFTSADARTEQMARTIRREVPTLCRFQRVTRGKSD
jgi:hypothetical protein